MDSGGSPYDIEYRAAAPSDLSPRRCAAPGCKNLTQRSARNGLSETLCKRHVEFRRRHGTHWRRSYTMAELRPFQTAARRWLKAHRGDHRLEGVVAALDGLLAGSGTARTAQDVRWAGTEEKVRNALARLHCAGKSGAQLLLITLTVKAAQAALGPRANPEFQYVQIAKMAHRLASGTHIRSGIWGDRHIYPRAEGSFMRLLGQTVEDIAGIVVDLEAVREVVAAAGRRDLDAL
ncbi:hypothetical protein FJ950_01185 [Mesorhizobium sp. B2-3-14]|uniref:hypothetical protein n=1 Tax=Mesorhizobium sp. B2-3-14 TaxID=2589950 RepID=UPI00112C5F54|nr:hypothetical protein [Mesorhizobium sp. B2-3-14]TPL88999.1 hypothetical protein FJ950_01185 [Mesorhizobium sp. B2-3-14]